MLKLLDHAEAKAEDLDPEVDEGSLSSGIITEALSLGSALPLTPALKWKEGHLACLSSSSSLMNLFIIITFSHVCSYNPVVDL